LAAVAPWPSTGSTSRSGRGGSTGSHFNGAGKTRRSSFCSGCWGRAPAPGARRGRLGDWPIARSVSPKPHFYDYLTGREFLDFCARLCGLPDAERRERVAPLLKLVGLEEAADVRLRKYSKGMLQRAGMAQALVNEPRLLILDEPLSGLDPAGRKQVRDLILQLRAEGRTVIFSSHILADAEMICDRVGIMNPAAGRLEAADELLHARVQAVEFEADGLGDAARGALRERATLFLEEGGRVRFTLRGDETQVPQVLAAIVAGGGQVVSVVPLHETLEDVFLREVQRP
jgi:ABC-2 type transport system ATP-binding protein